MANNHNSLIKTTAQSDDPPEMSKAYYSTHKMFGLFSGLLIAWELVGIELKDLPYATFKSPQAPPFVLVVLIIYFWFRFIIEYKQCNTERIKLLVVRIDFYVAQIIALLAIGLFVYQFIAQKQLFEQFLNRPYQLSKPGTFGLGFTVGYILRSSITMIMNYKRLPPKLQFETKFFILLSVLGLFPVLLMPSDLIIWNIGGLATGILFNITLRWILKGKQDAELRR